MRLSVVTGMVDPGRTREFWGSWRERSKVGFDCHVVLNGAEWANRPEDGGADAEDLAAVLRLAREGSVSLCPSVLGTVAAFARGMRAARMRAARMAPAGQPGHIIALLHDDLEILEDDWDDKVLDFFYTHPSCGLLGFGGAAGVGEAGMYQKPFDPMTLARHDFQSNMRDAEAHGRRVTEPKQVAVLDGFSLIGWSVLVEGALDVLQTAGVVHHAYDVYFGIHAKKLDWETWMLPLAVHHGGGRTAVLSQEYHRWAKDIWKDGDQTVWLNAHRKVWTLGMGVLPLVVD